MNEANTTPRNGFVELPRVLDRREQVALRIFQSLIGTVSPAQRKKAKPLAEEAYTLADAFLAANGK